MSRFRNITVRNEVPDELKEFKDFLITCGELATQGPAIIPTISWKPLARGRSQSSDPNETDFSSGPEC